MIDSFTNLFDFLSNFHECSVTYEGLTYKNSEAAFHAQKTLDPNIRCKFIDLNPSEAKKLGRKIQLREDWENVKDHIMYKICLAKFTQNPHLKRKLIMMTGNQLLEEGNYWHDNYWGNCHCLKCKNIKGQNKLGKILMRIREELRECSML